MTYQTQEQLIARQRATFIKTWLSEWYIHDIHINEHLTPSDWITIALTMIEMMVDTQNLVDQDREKVAFGLMAEMQKRFSQTAGDASAPH